MTLLLTGAEIGDEDADYAKLIAPARERLKRPWESAGLESLSAFLWARRLKSRYPRAVVNRSPNRIANFNKLRRKRLIESKAACPYRISRAGQCVHN